MEKFRDENLNIEERISDLISRLTIDEKIGFINYRNDGVPRLGINPYVWWNEALHGLARSGSATVFPQAIAMAATFSPELVKKMGVVIASEGRARHHDSKKHGDFGTYKGLTYWSPNVNIFRDPRWGRGHETYGECPFLTSELGVAYVQGVQGEDINHLKAVATPKHFAVHSGPEKTRLEFNSIVDERDLRETYLVAFKRCIEAGAQSIMSAYNAINGVPCSINSYLLNDILRGEWHFDGAVVTDAGAGEAMYKHHKKTDTYPAAIAKELKNGVDVITDWEIGAKAAYNDGLLSEDTIDKVLRNQLRVKFRLGLFDEEKDIPALEVIECLEHRKLALECSEKSLVLLKNQNNILPLNKKNIKTIAVIGPNADDRNVLLGNYFGTPTRTVTLLEGILNEVDDYCQVLYAKGCEIGALRTEACAEDYDRISEAISVAERADVVIMCMGLNPQYEGEAGDTFNVEAAGDKLSLNLPGLQNYLVEKIAQVNQKIIWVNVSGSALIIPESLCQGVIQCFYPGAEGGTALANILFGKTNPSGKLPLTFYKSDEDLADFGDYSMANRTYRFFDGEVLYPFGYGLSYTTFCYSNFGYAKVEIAKDAKVKLTVKNSGDIAGDEVIQLYRKTANASTRTPLKQLCLVKRVHLKPQEEQIFEFIIPKEEFLITYIDGHQDFEDCDWEICCG